MVLRGWLQSNCSDATISDLSLNLHAPSVPSPVRDHGMVGQGSDRRERELPFVLAKAPSLRPSAISAHLSDNLA